MKKFIIYHLSFIIVCVFALSATAAFAQTEAQPLTLDILPTKKIEANPINIAVMLMQENDTAAIARTLKYYGYTPDTSKPRNLKPGSPLTPDTSTPDTWIHPNGSTIRYSLTDPNTLSDYTVEVTSKGTTNEKEHNLLENLNFKKNGTAYEQKSIGFTTRATFVPHGPLILKRIPKVKE